MQHSHAYTVSKLSIILSYKLAYHMHSIPDESCDYLTPFSSAP